MSYGSCEAVVNLMSAVSWPLMSSKRLWRNGCWLHEAVQDHRTRPDDLRYLLWCWNCLPVKLPLASQPGKALSTSFHRLPPGMWSRKCLFWLVLYPSWSNFPSFAGHMACHSFVVWFNRGTSVNGLHILAILCTFLSDFGFAWSTANEVFKFQVVGNLLPQWPPFLDDWSFADFIDFIGFQSVNVTYAVIFNFANVFLPTS